MAKYVPSDEEFYQLRATFIELIDDYLVLYLMGGQRDFCDTFLIPSEKAQREENAYQTADDLMGLVDRIDTLAGTPALGQAWPELLATLKGYAGVHESFKPMRAVTKAWGDVDIGQWVGDPRRGRPPGPGTRAYTKENFQEEEQAARSRFIARERRRPSGEDIASEMMISPRLYYEYKREYQS